MNVADISINLLIMAVLMVFSAFFSGSETAFSALSKVQIFRIRSEKKRNSSYILQFVDNPSRLFITVLFGNILVNLAFISITSAMIYNDLFKGKNIAIASITAIGIELFVLLLFGEITPKSIAIRHAEKISRLSARPLWYFSQFILPVRKALKLITNMFLPLFGIHNTAGSRILTTNELKAKIKQAEHYGAINDKEGDIIANIFDLCSIEAGEAMVPRSEMICLDVRKTIKEAFHLSKTSRFSQLPVYRKDFDSICGIFNLKDYTEWMSKSFTLNSKTMVTDLTIEEFIANRHHLEKMYPDNEGTLVRLPFFSYKGRKIGELIRNLTSRKRRMVILLDEYGGVCGLITVKDIIDEVLGDILDDPDTVDGYPVNYSSDEPGTFDIPGLVSLRSIQNKFNWRTDETKAETVSGYVMDLCGSIPEIGDVIFDKKNNIEFQIISMDGNRIELIKVRPKKNG